MNARIIDICSIAVMIGFFESIAHWRRAACGFISNTIESSCVLPHDVGQVIGFSVHHRPILCYRMGNGARRVLFFAGIHGNETGTVKFVQRLFHALSYRMQYHHWQFLLIPCTNPDGYAEARQRPDYSHGGRIGRCNAHAVDLNRNFPTPSFVSSAIWNYGKNYRENTPVYAGDHPASEPEVQALISFILREKPDLIVAFHNAGGDVIGNPDQRSCTLAKSFANASGYRLPRDVHWNDLGQTGTAAEWCALQEIPYVEVEGRSRWASDWKRQKRGVEAMIHCLEQQ